MGFQPIGEFDRGSQILTQGGAWKRQQDGGYAFERSGVVKPEAEIRSANFSQAERTGWRLSGNGEVDLPSFHARASRSSNLSLTPAANSQQLVFNSILDTGGYTDHWSGSGDSFMAPENGVYLVTMSLRLVLSTGSNRVYLNPELRIMFATTSGGASGATYGSASTNSWPSLQQNTTDTVLAHVTGIWVANKGQEAFFALHDGQASVNDSTGISLTLASHSTTSVGIVRIR